MPSHSSPTIQEFRVRAVRVPLPEPHRTASGVVAESPLVLLDVVTDTGIIGHSLVFTYTPAALQPTAELIRNIEPLVIGDVLAPAEIGGDGYGRNGAGSRGRSLRDVRGTPPCPRRLVGDDRRSGASWTRPRHVIWGHPCAALRTR